MSYFCAGCKNKKKTSVRAFNKGEKSIWCNSCTQCKKWICANVRNLMSMELNQHSAYTHFFRTVDANFLQEFCKRFAKVSVCSSCMQYKSVTFMTKFLSMQDKRRIIRARQDLITQDTLLGFQVPPLQVWPISTNNSMSADMVYAFITETLMYTIRKVSIFQHMSLYVLDCLGRLNFWYFYFSATCAIL